MHFRQVVQGLPTVNRCHELLPGSTLSLRHIDCNLLVENKRIPVGINDPSGDSDMAIAGAVLSCLSVSPYISYALLSILVPIQFLKFVSTWCGLRPSALVVHKYWTIGA
ncbi:hypothetical protein RIF29_36458 [Crotalaria pallida]|uniref:Uncharacterized protein n=1 Tax=Crotalaria pallida TaxID=3830 RepID=A0AAN9HUC6_CROPI